MPKGGGKATVKDVMHKYKHGTLHSGSKKGPQVTDRQQAIAIALSEAGLSNKPPKRRKGHG
jgi:Family of unknown function (DUF6496)